MFREIRGLQQRRKGELRRWFQDPYFDLFLIEDAAGEVRWFQFCYARDTWRERVLEWHRGRGFLHLKVRDRDNPIRKDTGELVPEGNPGHPAYGELNARLAATPGLPHAIGAFVAAKLDEYARTAKRRRFLDSGDAGR